MTDAPRAAVVIVLLREDGRMLVIRRAAGVPRAGFWSPPTGRVEPGESVMDAVRREAREELGIEVLPVRQVWTSLTDDERYRLEWWWVRSDARALRPDPREIADLRWVAAEEFDALQPTFAQHRSFFDTILPDLVTDFPDAHA